MKATFVLESVSDAAIQRLNHAGRLIHHGRRAGDEELFGLRVYQGRHDFVLVNQIRPVLESRHRLGGVEGRVPLRIVKIAFVLVDQALEKAVYRRMGHDTPLIGFSIAIGITRQFHAGGHQLIPCLGAVCQDRGRPL